MPDSGVSLVTTALGTVLVLLTVGAIYLYGWRRAPDVVVEQSTPARRPRDDRLPTQHGGPMYESDVAEAETRSVEHDAFDPVGTAVLLVIYSLVVGLVWLFMYFVEFLGRGPTVVG